MLRTRNFYKMMLYQNLETVQPPAVKHKHKINTLANGRFPPSLTNPLTKTKKRFAV